MTSKHTPGPWNVAGRMGYGYLVDPNVCVAYGGEGSGRVDEGPANAILIAAAPDLLVALEEAPIPSKYHGERGFEVDRFLADYAVFSAMSRAAVAKARGGTAS